MSDIEKNIRRWVKYGILYSCGPYFFTMMIAFILGIMNYRVLLPGLLLTVFAVGINALGTLDEKEDKLFPRISYCKDMLQIVSFICIFIYAALFLISDLPSNYFFDISASVSDKIMKALVGTTFICCFLNCTSVIYVEIKIQKNTKNKKQNLKDSNNEE